MESFHFYQYRSTSGFRSSSGTLTSTGVQASAPTPSVHNSLAAQSGKVKPPPSLIATLNKAADCIKRHALLNTAQQMRDQHLELALTPLLPAVLVGMIRTYATEECLLPLQFTNYGCAIRNLSNEPVLERIQEIILSSDPGKHRFQLEMINNHGNLLDSVFAPLIDGRDRQELLRQAVLDQPQALSTLRFKFELMVNYLRRSRSQKVLDEELFQLKTHGAWAYDDEVKASQLNIRLLDEALQKINPESENCQRLEDRQSDQANQLMARASEHLVKKQTAKACELMLEAMDMFCRLRDRRGAVKVLIRLIELGKTEKTGHYLQLVKFVDLARKLCLVYPADFPSYAEVLLAMSEVCELHQDYSMMSSLYQLANADGMRLPFNYQATMLWRHIEADYHAGQPRRLLLQRILLAINCINKKHSRDIPERTASGKEITDLTPAQYFLALYHLYQLLSKLAGEQLARFQVMSFEQQDKCVTSFAAYFSSQRDSLEFNTASPMRYNHPVWKTARDWMVAIIADSYRNAINCLRVALFRKDGTALVEKEVVGAYSRLISLYRRANLVDDMEKLLTDGNAITFAQFPAFKIRLAGWCELLLTMKETQAKKKAE